jgi:hypothetical protein
MPSRTIAKTKTLRSKPKHAELALPKKKGTWGGARPGAGRKPGPDPKVPHRVRVEHDARHPLHVTLRRVADMPSFRSPQLLRLVREGILDTSETDLEGFRIAHFSIAPKQLDLLVEADDSAALTRGLRSLTIRIAVRVANALGRTGHVWGDRYRARPLTTPAQVQEVAEGVLGKTRETAQPARTALLRKLHS